MIFRFPFLLTDTEIILVKAELCFIQHPPPQKYILLVVHDRWNLPGGTPNLIISTANETENQQCIEGHGARHAYLIFENPVACFQLFISLMHVEDKTISLFCPDLLSTIFLLYKK